MQYSWESWTCFAASNGLRVKSICHLRKLTILDPSVGPAGLTEKLADLKAIWRLGEWGKSLLQFPPPHCPTIFKIMHHLNFPKNVVCDLDCRQYWSRDTVKLHSNGGCSRYWLTALLWTAVSTPMWYCYESGTVIRNMGCLLSSCSGATKMGHFCLIQKWLMRERPS